MRVIIIDSKNKKVYEKAIVGTLDDMQKEVGGLICLAITLLNNDDLYVNDEGLFKKDLDFFTIKGGHQPFAGNGIIVREEYDPKKEVVESLDCKSSLEEIKTSVQFLSRDQILKADSLSGEL